MCHNLVSNLVVFFIVITELKFNTYFTVREKDSYMITKIILKIDIKCLYPMIFPTIQLWIRCFVLLLIYFAVIKRFPFIILFYKMDFTKAFCFIELRHIPIMLSFAWISILQLRLVKLNITCIEQLFGFITLYNNFRLPYYIFPFYFYTCCITIASILYVDSGSNQRTPSLYRRV